MRKTGAMLALALACVTTVSAAPAGAAAASSPGSAAADAAATLPTAERQAQLLRTLRHDCGACHGLRLTGGLGPAITREALAARQLDLQAMTATIFHGRPGTPMPGWKAMLNEAEAGWLAGVLLRGEATP